LLCAVFVRAQVPVAIAPDVYPIYFGSTGTNAGEPLVSGFLYTYQAGTTTRQDTYVDSTGTVQNTWPIPLDAAGAPSNGSVETGIWLANSSYKFCAYNAALVQQWCRDNIVGYLGLLNLANTWSLQQTFSLPIIDTSTDNQLVLGAPGNQITVDFPPPSGNVTQHAQNTSDTFVYRATTDTLTNKTLTSPTIATPLVNGCTIQNQPGTYVCIANQNPTGTTANLLAKLTNAPSQVVSTATTDTAGAVGICVLNCGNTGTATIQQSGLVSCAFDNATTAGDYVQISSSVAGHCTDAGASYPLSGQVLGRVLSTNGVAQTYQIDLFGPEFKAAPSSTAGVVLFSGTGAGTGPTINCQSGFTCLENGGVVQVITGTAPQTSNIIVTVAFGGSHTAGNCTITPYLANAAALSGTSQVYASGSAINFTIVSGTVALAATTTYDWSYTCNFK